MAELTNTGFMKLDLAAILPAMNGALKAEMQKASESAKAAALGGAEDSMDAAVDAAVQYLQDAAKEGFLEPPAKTVKKAMQKATAAALDTAKISIISYTKGAVEAAQVQAVATVIDNLGVDPDSLNKFLAQYKVPTADELNTKIQLAIDRAKEAALEATMGTDLGIIVVAAAGVLEASWKGGALAVLKSIGSDAVLEALDHGAKVVAEAAIKDARTAASAALDSALKASNLAADMQVKVKDQFIAAVDTFGNPAEWAVWAKAVVKASLETGAGDALASLVRASSSGTGAFDIDAKVAPVIDVLTKVTTEVKSVQTQIGEVNTVVKDANKANEAYVDIAASAKENLGLACTPVDALKSTLGQVIDWLDKKYCLKIKDFDICLGGQDIAGTSFTMPKKCLSDAGLPDPECIKPMDVLNLELCGSIPNKCVGGGSQWIPFKGDVSLPEYCISPELVKADKLNQCISTEKIKETIEGLFNALLKQVGLSDWDKYLSIPFDVKDLTGQLKLPSLKIALSVPELPQPPKVHLSERGILLKDWMTEAIPIPGMTWAVDAVATFPRVGMDITLDSVSEAIAMVDDPKFKQGLAKGFATASGVPLAWVIAAVSLEAQVISVSYTVVKMDESISLSQLQASVENGGSSKENLAKAIVEAVALPGFKVSIATKGMVRTLQPTTTENTEVSAVGTSTAPVAAKPTVLQGTMAITVPSCTAFVANVNATSSIQEGLAAATTAPVAYIDVKLVCSARRLSQTRRLANETETVNADYTITIPATDKSVSASSVIALLDGSVSAGIVAKTISQQTGITVTVSVTKPAVVEDNETPPTKDLSGPAIDVSAWSASSARFLLVVVVSWTSIF
ncbi:unnamed protein product [Polarella glacialis]|uniref:Uncharacterized protein n=1 Tax=Polarella glacialis TaxID=89957 RepID=A0A813GH58_POLGL|nr:unnamed protein product [Polarella glacialis]CAE8698983.1 unnamed protein product [Polarella glacialis]